MITINYDDGTAAIYRDGEWTFEGLSKQEQRQLEQSLVLEKTFGTEHGNAERALVESLKRDGIDATYNKERPTGEQRF